MIHLYLELLQRYNNIIAIERSTTIILDSSVYKLISSAVFIMK